MTTGNNFLPAELDVLGVTAGDNEPTTSSSLSSADDLCEKRSISAWLAFWIRLFSP